MIDSMSSQIDHHLWLEEPYNPDIDSWVKDQNRNTIDKLTSDSRFEYVSAQLQKLHAKGHRKYSFVSPSILVRGDMIYEAFRDEAQKTEVFRRTHFKCIYSSDLNWEVLFNVSDISRTEEVEWQIQFQSLRFSPCGRRLLVPLSDNGSDAVIFKEFDLIEKEFLQQGFNSPLQRQWAAWLTTNSVLIASSLSEDEITTANCPRKVRLWKRGESIDSSKVVYEAPAKNTVCKPLQVDTRTNHFVFIEDARDFSNRSLFIVSETGSVIPIELPEEIMTAEIFGLFSAVGLDHFLIIKLNTNWTIGSTTYKAGSLIAMDVIAVKNQNGKTGDAIALVYEPNKNEAISPYFSITASNRHLYINVLKDVASRLIKATPSVVGSNYIWNIEEVHLPAIGNCSLSTTTNHLSDKNFAIFESFLNAPRLYSIDDKDAFKPITKNSGSISQQKYVTEQYFATASDNTNIPYFVTRPRRFNFSGDAPTLLYAYAGFGTPVTPMYDIPYFGPLIEYWVKNCGVFIAVNARGGGEYGPKWHEAAKGPKRQVAYNDIYSICEDIFNRGITAPKHLGMIGGSGGGLTMGVILTQRPDLCNAIISVAPLLDMLRYHKLSTGACFIDEFGCPDISADANVLKGYSPYHNLSRLRSYPEPFFMTSTSDDRVHPAHARKMTAKMIAENHPVLFFETSEGGHLLATDAKGKAFLASLQLIYLFQKLSIKKT